MNKLVFKLNNLHCEACLKMSKMKLSKIPGVLEVNIEGLDGNAEILAEREIKFEEIKKALAGTGYEVVKI